jgi:hypothetical protein
MGGDRQNARSSEMKLGPNWRKQMHLDRAKVLAPGQHPYDPPKSSTDPVGYALERLQTYLIWCDEHRNSYEKARERNPTDAANEMSCLKDAIEQAILHLHRLTELVLIGQGMDSKKELPNGLCNEVWDRTVKIIAHGRGLGPV